MVSSPNVNGIHEKHLYNHVIFRTSSIKETIPSITQLRKSHLQGSVANLRSHRGNWLFRAGVTWPSCHLLLDSFIGPPPAMPSPHTFCFLLFLVLFCFETGSCCAALCDLELEILLPRPPECWAFRHELPCPGSQRLPSTRQTQKAVALQPAKILVEVLPPIKLTRILQKSLVCRNSKVTSSFKTSKILPKASDEGQCSS